MTKADKEGQRKAPILRFKGFTDDWEQRKLKQLGNIKRGASPRPISDPKWFDKNGKYGWLRISDVTSQNGQVFQIDQHLSSIGEEKTVLISDPHLIISIAATVGKPCINYIPTAIHDGFVTFLDYKFNLDFMFEWFNKNQNIWLKYGQPGAQINLNSSIIGNQEIKLPKAYEQEKIAKLFNILNNLLALYEKKKQLLTQLKQGIVNFLITKNGQKSQLRFSGFNNNWESKSFEKLLNYEQPTKYIVKKADYISQGTPVLTANKSFVLGYTNETNVYQNIPAIIFDDFTLESKYVDFPFMVKSSAIKILTSKNSNLFFIYQLLNNQRFVQEGHSRHYISVVQKKKVLVPSIQEQNKISDLIKQLEDNIELNSNTIVLLKKLKEFLLQNMFL